MPEEPMMRSPLEITYVKRLIFSLSLIGGWPHQHFGAKKRLSDHNAKIFIIISCGGIYLCSKYAKKHYHQLNILILGRLILNIVIASVGLQRSTTFLTGLYKDVTKKFMTKIHLFHHKESNSYAMEIYNTVEKMSSLLSSLIQIEYIGGVIFFNYAPIQISYSRGMFRTVKPENATYDFSCYYDLPFDYETELKGFIVVYIYNTAMSMYVSLTVLFMDLYIFIVVFHIWGHIKLLIHNLESFPKPEMTATTNFLENPPWFNEEESVKVYDLLKESLNHYYVIKNFMDEVSMAFGATICYYYCFHQIAGCLLLLELYQLNQEAVMSYGILTVVLFQQLIQMSIVFELIGTQSEKIKDAVYGVPWECMDTKNRRIVCAYLMYAQDPLQLKALGMLPVGVQVMASIIKTTLSYFMLLRTATSHE